MSCLSTNPVLFSLGMLPLHSLLPLRRSLCHMTSRVSLLSDIILRVCDNYVEELVDATSADIQTP